MTPVAGRDPVVGRSNVPSEGEHCPSNMHQLAATRNAKLCWQRRIDQPASGRLRGWGMSCLRWSLTYVFGRFWSFFTPFLSLRLLLVVDADDHQRDRAVSAFRARGLAEVGLGWAAGSAVAAILFMNKQDNDRRDGRVRDHACDQIALPQV